MESDGGRLLDRKGEPSRSLAAAVLVQKSNILCCGGRAADKDYSMYAYFWVVPQLSAIGDQEIVNRIVGPPTKETHLALNENRLTQYVDYALGRVSHCHVADVVESREIELPEKSTAIISNEAKRRVEHNKLGNLYCFYWLC